MSGTVLLTNGLVMNHDLESLNQKIKQLKEENTYLRKMLGLSENQEILARKSKVINNLSSTEDKIKLFRSLFKGREDFFAQRWENNGRSGYSPVCNNKWAKPKGGLPKIKCINCEYRSTTKLSFDSMIAYKIETGSNAVDGNITLAKQLSILSEDIDRNNKICNDIAQALDKGRKPLLLTERVSHLKILEEKLSPICDKIIVLKGNMKTKAKETTKNKLASLSSNDKFIIIATGKYVGEGFDLPILDTLFLALPISWKGTLNQYIGRIVRTYENKTSIEVYDYVDGNIERLSKMYNKRKKAYKSLGFSIIDKQSSLI